MKPSPSITTGTRQLFAWLQRYQPRVFAGLVRRFTPREQQLSGISDMLGSALNAASSFINSQGFEKVLTAAQPFIANRVEKEQLELQLTRIKNGLPPTAPGSTSTAAATGGPGGPGDPSRGQAPPPPAAEREIPWGWIAGGTAAAAGLALLLGGRRRG